MLSFRPLKHRVLWDPFPNGLSLHGWNKWGWSLLTTYPSPGMILQMPLPQPSLLIIRGPAPPSPSLQRAASAFQRLAEAASREGPGPPQSAAAVTLPRWGFWGAAGGMDDEGQGGFGATFFWCVFVLKGSCSYEDSSPFKAKISSVSQIISFSLWS